MNIKVNDVNLYYEVYGSGKPVILVHGNGESHEIFDKLSEKLKEEYKVYALDSRCHGKSEDTKKISYDLMAEDVIAFIEELKIEKPVFYGFSDGGNVGLLIAVKRPELLSELIISGANLNPRGMAAKDLFLMKLGYIFHKDKLVRMMLKEPDITTEDLEKIVIPTHVVAGEKDVIREKHTRFIAEHIKGSTLLILPGETHGSYIVHSEKIYHVLKKYL